MVSILKNNTDLKALLLQMGAKVSQYFKFFSPPKEKSRGIVHRNI